MKDSLNFLIEYFLDSSCRASPPWKIRLREATIAPSRFELLSTDSESAMLGHYTTGLTTVIAR